eukprot:2616899-Prymnesium_polylepis.1
MEARNTPDSVDSPPAQTDGTTNMTDRVLKQKPHQLQTRGISRNHPLYRVAHTAPRTLVRVRVK